MTKIAIEGFIRSDRTALILLVFGVIFASSCSSMKNMPKSVSVLAAEPMNHTMLSSYPTIDTVFKSDQQILIFATWEKADESDGHTIAWEILNQAGEKVYSSHKENYTIHPHMCDFWVVPLSKIEKPGAASDQLVVHLSVDGQLAATQNIRYEDKDIVRKDIQRIVVLPFIEYCDHPGPWQKSAKILFQNTMADAIYCEVARIFPDSVPHYVAEQKIGKELGRGCPGNADCVNFVKEKFGTSFLVFGELYIQQFDLDASSLTVYLYDPRNDRIKKFNFFEHYNYTYESLVKDLLKGVLYKEGLIKYLVEG